MAETEATLPSEEELAKLPAQARKAFVGRCVERVFAIGHFGWADTAQECADGVRQVVPTAKAGSSIDAGPPGPAEAAERAAKAADATGKAKAEGAAEPLLGRKWLPAVVRAIRDDYQLLLRKAEAEGWTDGTPVSTGSLGALWPDGAPAGWPHCPGKRAPVATEEELAELPRWAVVAFAARCARRVLPIFRAVWRHGRAELEAQRAVIQDVEQAESLAAAAGAVPGARLESGERPLGATEVAATAAEAAANAARAARDATDCPGSGAGLAETAARAAGNAAEHVGRAARLAAERAMCHDYQLVREAAEEEGWTDDTAVPAQRFKALWPDGAPEGWPPAEAPEGEG